MNVPPRSFSRGQQLSPVSTIGSEWSGMNNYDHTQQQQQQQRGDSPYSPSVNLNHRDLVGPPDSGSYGGSSNGQINGGYDFPSRPMDIPHGRRPSETGSHNSSPAVSIANSRSSDGTISDQQSRKYRRMEYELSQHYTILRQFLKGGANQGPKQNKAKDKLLRLSPVQFHELSTDVFDELQRRQALNSLPGRPPVRRENVPPFLQPKGDFHEKRNQARQKLSSLQPPRFRDLATDVFLELERRFPQFADPNRREQPRSGSGSRGPSGQGPNGFPGGSGPNGFVPPPRNHSHGQSGSISQNNQRFGQRNGSMANVPQFDNPPNPSDSDYGRPMAKQFQSNTVTPNKSTMVEDDDGRVSRSDSRFDRSSDAFGLESAITSHRNDQDNPATSRIGMSSHSRDAKLSEIAQAQLSEMQRRVEELEKSSRDKDEEIGRLQGRARLNGDDDWVRTKQDLEQKLSQAEQLNESLRDEIDRLHNDHADIERDLRSQLDTARKNSIGNDTWKTKHGELERKHQGLQDQFDTQRQVTEEVRMQATQHLNEMRAMAEGSGGNWEREEKLHNDVQRLEEEVKEWRARYAKTKTALRSVRASSLGLSIARPDAGKATNDDAFRHEQGLVKDVNITKFQISIDELLRIARAGEPSAVLEYMKAVVLAVRSITHDIDTATPASKDDDIGKKRSKLKSKVSATANNVITACKNFASADGISPVSLLDAAASHLTAAVVELVRTVKIRPTPPGDLEDDDDETLEPLQKSGYFSVADTMRRRTSAQDSIYSALSTPTEAQGHSGPGPSVHSRTTSHNGNMLNGLNREPSTSPGFGMGQDETELEELRLYLDDQTENLVQCIQSLVASIRSEDLMPIIRSHISNIGDVVSNVVSATEGSFEEPSSYSAALKQRTLPITNILTDCKTKLLKASVDSQALDGLGRAKEVKDFTSRLPPLAFGIARETKELVQRVEALYGGGALANESEDFS